ncbi:hypothetical protein GCM10022221_44030 [Actinocorallia aurea]
MVVVDPERLRNAGADLIQALASRAAHAVVDRDDSDNVLGAAVRSIAAGSGWVSPHLVPELCRALARPSSGSTGRPWTRRLTPVEIEVLDMVAKSLTNARIARVRGIAEATVKGHVQSLMRKLGCHSRVELAVFAHIGRRYTEQDPGPLLGSGPGPDSR